jgi:type VI secretion system protein ImpM
VPGFYGKLPGLGDFVSRRLPRHFIDPWDQWLQDAVATSKQQLGDVWLDYYLNSPLWRFAICPGVCGPDAWAGVIMPSVDRVGRYFPLTIAQVIPPQTNLLQLTNTHDWFERAEDLVLGALDEQGFSLDRFDASVGALGEIECTPAATQVERQSRQAWQIGIPSVESMSGAYPVLLQHLLSQAFSGYSLWWTQGSQHQAPCGLLCQGLPPIQGYVSMLGAAWEAPVWQAWPAVTAAVNTVAPQRAVATVAAAPNDTLLDLVSPTAPVDATDAGDQEVECAPASVESPEIPPAPAQSAMDDPPEDIPPLPVDYAGLPAGAENMSLLDLVTPVPKPAAELSEDDEAHSKESGA